MPSMENRGKRSFIRMLITDNGTPNGIHFKRYHKEEVYEVGKEILESLAEAWSAMEPPKCEFLEKGCPEIQERLRQESEGEHPDEILPANWTEETEENMALPSGWETDGTEIVEVENDGDPEAENRPPSSKRPPRRRAAPPSQRKKAS